MLEVIGDDGSARAFDSEMSALSVAKSGQIEHAENWASLLHVDRAYETELREFALAIANETPVPMEPWKRGRRWRCRSRR